MATLWFKGKGGKLSRVWAVEEYQTYPSREETRWAWIVWGDDPFTKERNVRSRRRRHWSREPLSRLVVMADDSQQETYDSQPGR